MVNCPICGKSVREANINKHIDSGCELHLDIASSQTNSQPTTTPRASNVSSFFATNSVKRTPSSHGPVADSVAPSPVKTSSTNGTGSFTTVANGSKRLRDDGALGSSNGTSLDNIEPLEPPSKRMKPPSALEQAAPLAERMRPSTLEDVCGQELVGPSGVLRGLIEQNRVPSMILWGASGTGKTTIARVIANMVGSRFVEINSTNSGVAECKRIFVEARNELSLTRKKTILFCDEIHRFSKSQQDVFLGPVESGVVTLIGATTENPSFKVQGALLSRCRTFTLQKLTDDDITVILQRALESEKDKYTSSDLVDSELLQYLAAFSDGDARTALNLLDLAFGLSSHRGMTKMEIKKSLTKTMVYDRAGDQHYDTISAFQKSIRGSDADAAVYYLARALQSGEDPLFIARRLVIIASEDIGLADNTMLSLATAAYTAAEKIGMPEARINLAHVTVALALSKKSTRAYRSYGKASAALREPGVAGLPIPIHLRNAPTKLMKELGYGKEYKYNPSYKDGKVAQEYLPDALKGKVFLENDDLGDETDARSRIDLEAIYAFWFHHQGLRLHEPQQRHTFIALSKRELSQAYMTFSLSLSPWKNYDERVLIGSMLAQYVALDNIWQKIKNDIEKIVKTKYKKGIRYIQIMVMMRIKSLVESKRAKSLIKE
ncbi:MAG: hypothetical protein M1817_002609 [Caeruleum heppii]|nr:MAG: hypothetical protein M1817_002609 [Caeruleum heppii]